MLSAEHVLIVPNPNPKDGIPNPEVERRIYYSLLKKSRANWIFQSILFKCINVEISGYLFIKNSNSYLLRYFQGA